MDLSFLDRVGEKFSRQILVAGLVALLPMALSYAYMWRLLFKEAGGLFAFAVLGVHLIVWLALACLIDRLKRQSQEPPDLQ